MTRVEPHAQWISSVRPCTPWSSFLFLPYQGAGARPSRDILAVLAAAGVGGFRSLIARLGTPPAVTGVDTLLRRHLLVDLCFLLLLRLLRLRPV